MSLLESNDENDSITEDKINIQEKLKQAKEKAVEYNNYLTQITDSGENQISLTDKESRLMKCNNNMLVGFNMQANVDTKSHLITAIDISNKPNDNGNMFEMAEKVKQAFEIDQVEQLADGGYVDNNDIKMCLENKIVPILPDDTYTITFDYNENEITDKIKKGSNVEDVKKCLESGIIPECYSYFNMDIKVITTQEAINEEAVFHSVDEEELKVKAKEGFFVRNRNLNCVYCPMGNILNFKRKKANNDLFIGNSQCLNCLNKCTCKCNKRIRTEP